MLLREGLPPDRVVKSGSPMFEILTHFAPQIAASDVLQRLDLSEGGYYVVSAHREENIDSERNFPRLAEVIDRLAERQDVPVMVSTHPRTRQRIDVLGSTFHPHVQQIRPPGLHAYIPPQHTRKA